MYGAVRLACEGQLAAIVQKRSRAGNVQIEIDTAFFAGDGKDLDACTARRIPATTFAGAK